MNAALSLLFLVHNFVLLGRWCKTLFCAICFVPFVLVVSLRRDINRSRADKSAVVNSGGRLCAHTMPLCLYNFEARFVYLFSFDFRGISVVVSSTGKPCFRRGRRVRHFITMRICTLSARTTGGQHISSVNMDARGTNEQRQMGWFGDSVHFGWKQSYLR